MDKDTQLAQVRRELEIQEAEIGQIQQQISEIQHKENDTKIMHKLEIVAVKITLSINNDEIFTLKNHNKMLVTKLRS